MGSREPQRAMNREKINWVILLLPDRDQGMQIVCS